MPNHHYLPSLSTAPGVANVAMPQRSAHWEEAELSLLHSVARGIAVDQGARARGVSSIPDVWARAVLFQNALRGGPAHPLHDRFLPEWRGLLSLLALREVYGYPVTLTSVDTSGPDRFSKALRDLAPDVVALERGVDYAWTEVLLIRYDGEPIGATSPGALVFTATGYEARLKGKGLDLCDAGGRLRAPTHASDPHTAHYVAEWLYNLLHEVEPVLAAAPSPASDDLLRLLQEWLAEFRRDFGLPPHGPVNAPLVQAGTNGPVGVSQSAWQPLGHYALYRHLLTPLEEGPQPPLADQSGLFLQTGDAGGQPRLHLRHRGQPVKGVIVIHESTLDENAQVWGLRRLRSLGNSVPEVLARHFDAPAGDSVAGIDLSRQGAIWIRPERYFLTDTLVAPRLGEGNHVLAFGEREANAGGEYLLPFRKTVLDFFGADEVQRTLKPQFQPQRDGSVRFSFELPVGALRAPTPDGPAPHDDGLTGQFRRPSDSVRTVRVERVYRELRDGDRPAPGEGVLRHEALPVIDLFPRYLGPTWRRYYLFQSDADRFTAAPYAHGAEHAERVRTDETTGPKHTARIVGVQGDDPFPDGVVVGRAEGDPLGLILTPRRQWNATGLSNSWIVGVDFGTSNTNVALRRNGGDAEGWATDFPRLLRPLTTTTSGGAGGAAAPAKAEQRRNELLQRFFVPNRRVAFPIPTLLDVQIADTRLQTEGRLLLDYFVHFPPRYDWPEPVRYNLKWGSPRLTREFLEGILFLVLLEATDQKIQALDLRCSFPKAFSQNEQAMFRGDWQQLHQDILNGGPSASLRIVDGLTSRVDPPSFFTEGDVAGFFFSSKHTIPNSSEQALQNRSVIIDVGGGTTDIAFWYGLQRGEIVHDDSARLAGREVARYLHAQPRLVEILLGKETSGEALRALRSAGSDIERFNARLNLVLRAEDRTIRQSLVDNAGLPEIQQFRLLLALEFGALAFYAGTLLGAAERWGRAPGLSEQLATGGISLHWGGNAAKLVSWIDLGDYRPDGLGAQLLNGVLYWALHDAEMEPKWEDLRQPQSPAHKAEAAMGMTVAVGRSSGARGGPPSGGRPPGSGGRPPTPAEPPAGGDGAPGAQPFVAGDTVCGENITLIDGPSLGFLDPLSRDDLYDTDRHRVAHVSGDRLARFVEVFNDVGAGVGLLDASTAVPGERLRVKVTEKTKAHFDLMARMDVKDRYVEPVFITEAKELIGLVIADLS